MKKQNLFRILFSLLLVFQSCSKDDEQNNNSQNDIVGVWMVYTNNFPVSNEMVYKFRVFFENGKSLSNLPNEGLYNYNIDQEQNWQVGNYTFSNASGSGKISPNSQYEENYTLLETNKLKVDNDCYQKCTSINNQKLNASYTSYSDPTDPTLATLQYGEKPVITFFDDGSFLDEGIFNTYLFDAEINPEAAAPGYGSYTLKDFSIILKYEDGTNRIRQEAFNSLFSSDIISSNIIFMHRTPLSKIH
jgi:hypothetical protein